MKKSILSAVAAAFLCALVQGAPVNDDYDNPIEFPARRYVPNYPSTLEGSLDRRVWYTWTAPASGQVTISTQGGFLLQLELVDEFDFLLPLAQFRTIWIDQDFYTCEATFDAKAGRTYRIGASEDLSFGIIYPSYTEEFSIGLQQEMGQLPDNVADALLILKNKVSAEGGNFTADAETGEPLHAGVSNEKSVWFQWTATSRSSVSFDTVGTKFDTVIGVYLNGADIATLVPVTSNDDISTNVFTPIRQSKVNFIAENGVTYLMAVAAKDEREGIVRFNFEATPRHPDFGKIPKAVYARETTTALLEAPAQGTGAITYKWQRKPVGQNTWLDLAAGATYGGVTSPTLSVANVTAAMNGDVFRCLAKDDVGESVSRAISLVVTEFAPLEVTVGGPSSIDLSNNTPPPAGAGYYVKGLPKGFTLDPATGIVTATDSASAKPGTYVVSYGTFTTNSAGKKVMGVAKTVLVIVSELPENISGKFEAILEDPVTTLPVGKAEFTVNSKTATFTGRVTLLSDKKVLSVKGDLTLNATFDVATAAVQIARGKDVLPYRLDLSLDNSQPDSPNYTLAVRQLDANSIVTSTIGQSLSVSKVATYTAADPAPWAGIYTILLNNPASPPANLGSTPIPEGTGSARATVTSPKGDLKIRGKLGDGTTVTASLAPAADASYRWYTKLYKDSGYFGGWLDFNPVAGDQAPFQISAASDAELYWAKSENLKDRSYRAGFGPVSISATSQVWTPVISPEILRDTLLLDGNTGVIALSLTSTGLPADDLARLPSELVMQTTNIVRVLTPAANSGAFSLSANSGAGSFTARFKLIDGRSVSAEGVLLQLPARVEGSVIGEGFFTLPSLIKGGESTTGRIRLTIPTAP